MNSPKYSLNSFIQESHHQNLKIYVLVYKLILKSNYALTKFYHQLLFIQSFHGFFFCKFVKNHR